MISNKKRYYGTALLCFLGPMVVMGVATSGIASCTVRDVSAGSAPVVASASGTNATIPAPTAKPEPRTFVGVLLPPQMANISSRADGRLVGVPVKVGQRVRKGDVLAVFDAREQREDLAMAEAQLKGSQGAAAAAGAELGAARGRASRRNAVVEVNGRRISLVSGEEASQSVFDASGAAGRAASAAGQVAAGRARIGALKVALEETELRAPFDGVVTGAYFEAGMNVHAKETVVRVVGGGNGLRVRMALPEEDSAGVHPGSVARLSLDDGRQLAARLERVSPEVDPVTRTFFVEGDVEIQADDQQAALLAGRTVRVMIAR